ncbi:MAG: glycosyl hydrolase family 65 protein [Microthrixaceae bacterium]
MAGTVDLIQRCYGGIDTREDMLHINPSLPVGLPELAFSISYRGQLVSLEISHERQGQACG